MESRTARIRVKVKGSADYLPLYGASADAFIGVLGNSSNAAQDYEAAGQGRRATTWRTTSAGPNASLTYALPTLINRSRDAVRKNPLADSAVDSIVTNVIGTGIKPQFRTPDRDLNQYLAELWLDWTDEADADHRNDWYGLEALATRAMVEAGEVFARFRVRRAGEMETVPLQLQVLESEFCPVNEFRPTQGRNLVRNGVEFNMLGQRQAYWMYRQHPNDWSVQGGYADLMPYPVPASEVIHLYQSRRPGQIRGEPWLTRALIKLRELDQYDDAELMRKKTAALFAGFVTKPEAEGFGGEDPDADGDATQAFEPGTMIPLGMGEDVKFSEPADVGGSYEQFMREQKRGVAVAAGTLYEQLSGDYSQVNDRTYRASVNEFRRRAAMWQHNLIVYQFCRKVMRRWLDLGVMSGAIDVPDSFGPRDLYRVKWVPQGWAYIHPVQEVQAARDEIRAGLRSRAEHISERGYDAEQVDQEIADDNRRADDYGLVFDSDPRKVTNTGMTQARPEGSQLPPTEPGEENESGDDAEEGDDPLEGAREPENVNDA